MFADSQICTLCICNNIMGLKKEKPHFFQQYLQKMRKEKFSRNLVLLIFIITITGEDGDFNDNDASGQGELPA